MSLIMEEYNCDRIFGLQHVKLCFRKKDVIDLLRVGKILQTEFKEMIEKLSLIQFKLCASKDVYNEI